MTGSGNSSCDADAAGMEVGPTEVPATSTEATLTGTTTAELAPEEAALVEVVGMALLSDQFEPLRVKAIRSEGSDVGSLAGMAGMEEEAVLPTPTQCCVMCLDAPMSHIFIPCGHNCACGPCSALVMDSSKACPICRADATMCVQVYTP